MPFQTLSTKQSEVAEFGITRLPRNLIQEEKSTVDNSSTFL